MFRAYDAYEVEMFEDEDGSLVATCDVFPQICGLGETAQEAADDLADSIADYMRRVVIH